MFMWAAECVAHLSLCFGRLFLAVFWVPSFWLFFGALTFINHNEDAGIIAAGAVNMFVVSASYPSQ